MPALSPEAVTARTFSPIPNRCSLFFGTITEDTL
jgi:hypothetical protein